MPTKFITTKSITTHTQKPNPKHQTPDTRHQTPETSPQTPVSGFSYLEVIIAAGVLLIMAHAFFTLITASYQLLAISRIESSARAIANHHLEIIRNLPYDDVGTISGIPSGTIPQVQTQTVNGQTYTITTTILYIDDPYDNTAPTDTLPIDYKRVRVTITWDGTFPTQEITTLITDITPNGVETTADGGTLQILIFDSLGQPVPQAQVNIQAPTAVPPVSLDVLTDNFGTTTLPGAPICTGCYNLTITKTGFSTDRTYTTSEITNPAQPPATVLDGQVTQLSFAIDQLSSITFISQDPTYSNLGNIDFHLTGNKIIGTQTDGTNVYKIDQDYTTDGSGNLTLDLEWGTYTLTLNNTTHDLAGSNPTNPIPVAANATANYPFIAANTTPHSLLTLIQDASGSAVASASAVLTNTALSFEYSITTPDDTSLPDFGQAFFNNLSSNSYDLQISHPDYQTNTSTIDINGPTQNTTILNPN